MSHVPDASNLLSPALLARLERLELVTRKIFRGRLKGERRSRRLGQSVEFADYRDYVAGDDLRFLDWNLFARLDKLFLRLFLEEEDLHFFAVLDASSSMDYGAPTKLHYARQLAAALGFVGLVRADRVQVAVLGGAPRAAAPPLRGRRSLRRLLDQLAEIQPGLNVPLAPSLREFCLRHPTKGILVLLTDLLDKQGYEQALQPLVAQQMDVYVVHILAREELEPNLQGDLRLVDCEDRAVADVTISRPLLDRYQQTLHQFLDGARQYCHRRGLSYLLAPTDVPIEDVVTKYLRQRGLVR
ncbi:MAG: DUF58 domain-containing protein [Pirellulaceae bacterium]|jgi:uncharacterized protein (DUF58 family)|nr:DUF58 domain-containing protein [Pirellulaceae bacterium]